MSAQGKLLRLARRFVWLYVLAAFAYWTWRFDVQTLPEQGCSPLHALRPGARLLLDMRSRRIGVGDIVLFLGKADELLLGRVADPPPGTPQDSRWVLTDNPDCPGPDSRTFGPIPAERCVGRLLFVLPFG